MQVASQQGSHRMVAPLIECLFDSGALRLSLAAWDLTYAGNTYFSAGTLMEVKAVRESTGSIEGMQFTLSGLSPEIIEIASDEPYRGRIVRLLKAYFDPANNQMVNEPRAWFVGRMRSMSIAETNDTCTVSVTAEHYEAELGRAAPLRLNDADQQRLFPGDLGCQYAEVMSEKKITWPDKRALIAG